jgi:hypothetical protein
MTPEELEEKAETLARQITYDNLVYGRSGLIIDKETNELRVATQDELDAAVEYNNGMEEIKLD